MHVNVNVKKKINVETQGTHPHSTRSITTEWSKHCTICGSTNAGLGESCCENKAIEGTGSFHLYFGSKTSFCSDEQSTVLWNDSWFQKSSCMGPRGLNSYSKYAQSLGSLVIRPTLYIKYCSAADMPWPLKMVFSRSKKTWFVMQKIIPTNSEIIISVKMIKIWLFYRIAQP